MTGADSAGRPWAGRSFDAQPSAWAGDDGSAPPAFLAAIARFHAGEAGPDAVVEALRTERLLVPMLPELSEAGTTAEGRVHDKKAELALVTVAGPDGRRVLPAFSSATAMQRWNPLARPVPAPARQVALGAASDGTELVIVDPASDTQFGLRRSALEALARDLPWTPSWTDPEVLAAIRAGVAGEQAVVGTRVGADDPAATLEGAEVRVVVVLAGGLDLPALRALLARVQQRWQAHPVVAARIDSLAVRVEAA